MGRMVNQSRFAEFRTALLVAGFCLLLVGVVAAAFYYLNQDNELLPESHPSSPKAGDTKSFN